MKTRILLLFLLFPSLVLAQETTKLTTPQNSTYLVYGIFIAIFVGVLWGIAKSISYASKKGGDPGHYLMEIAAKNKVLGLEIFLVFLNIVEMLVPATIVGAQRDPVQSMFLHVVIAAGGIWLGMGIYRNIGEAMQAFEEWQDLKDETIEDITAGTEVIKVTVKDISAQAIKDVYKFYTVHKNEKGEEYKVYSTDKWVLQSRKASFYNECIEVVSSILASILIPFAVVWLTAKALNQTTEYWNFISGFFNFTAVAEAHDSLATSCVVMVLHLITIGLLVIRSISLNRAESHPYDIAKIMLIEEAKNKVIAKQGNSRSDGKDPKYKPRPPHVGDEWDDMSDDNKKHNIEKLDKLFNKKAKDFISNVRRDLKDKFPFGKVDSLADDHPRNKSAIVFSNLEEAYKEYLSKRTSDEQTKLKALSIDQIKNMVEEVKSITMKGVHGINGMTQVQADQAISSIFQNIFQTWNNAL